MSLDIVLTLLELVEFGDDGGIAPLWRLFDDDADQQLGSFFSDSVDLVTD